MQSASNYSMGTMAFLFFFLFLFNTANAEKTLEVHSPHSVFINAPKFNFGRAEHVVSESLVSMVKLIEKGYINKELLEKLLNESSKSPHFRPFIPWFRSVKEISALNISNDLILVCQQYLTRKEVLPLERMLERMAGNYCRERALESIGREIEKSNVLSDEAAQFIRDNLKFFLTRKNKKNFAYFLQSQTTRKDILKKLSQEITTFSVKNDIVPSHEVLKDIEINEQITRLIQTKGFNPLQHQNVFYAEFGKLIEQGYRMLDGIPEEGKVKEHYKFLVNYLDLNQDHLPVGLCLSRLNDYSKAVFRATFKDLSRDIFRYIVKKGHKDIYDDALFFYMWTYLAHNDYKGALKIAKAHHLLDKNTQVTDARLKFWVAHCLEKTEQTTDAIREFEGTILSHPLSYYSIMSTKRLQVLRPDSPAVGYYLSAIKSNQSLSVDVKDIEDDHASSLVRLKAWAKIDSQRFIKLELKRLHRHSMPNLLVKHSIDKQAHIKSDLHLVNARIIQETSNHLSTFRYLYTVLEKKEVIFGRPLLEILYPVPYLEELSKELKKEKLDPIILLSLIRQESVFNPMARSPVGARGLMQLMPKTAKRMRNSVTDKHLVNPLINIQLGSKYFMNLHKRYDGNLVYVLSAYNAGESRVIRWKNLYFENDESIIKNIEAIPFLETRNYVKLIFRNIFFYKLLLDKNEVVDPSESNKIFDVHLGFKR